MMTQQSRNRFVALDAARGGAIIAMIAYHIIFDLNYFGIFAFDPQFKYLAYPIAGTFIFIAGISLHLKAESIGTQSDRRLYIRTFLSRGLKILLIAALITLVTWFYPHDGFIVFGILHLIGTATLLAIPFLPFGKWNVIPASLVLLIGFFFFPIIGPAYLIPIGVYPPGFTSLDYEPLIPWFSLILFGIAAGSIGFSGKKIQNKSNPLFRILAIPGRNSLIIYLIHQPVIIGTLVLIGLVTI